MRKPDQQKTEGLALSVLQKRLFFLNEISKNSIAFNRPLFFKVNQGIDQKRFEASIKAVLKKHNILRTVFRLVGKEPYQFVLDEIAVEIKFYAKATFFKEKDFTTQFVKPFVLQDRTPLRIEVLKIEDNSHLVGIDCHEILLDEVSQHIFIKELQKQYQLNEPFNDSVQFDDNHKDKNVVKDNTVRNAHKFFWTEQFRDYPEKLELPLDFSRPLIKTHKGERVSVDLEEETFLKLGKLQEASGIQMFDVLFGVFTVFLGKITNQEDISIGTVADQRMHTKTKNTLGNFTDTVVLRNYHNGHIIFNNFLKTVANHRSESLKNMGYTYEELINDLNLDCNISRNPLFDVMFLYKTAALKPENFNQNWKIYNAETVISKHDLTLVVIEDADKISFDFEYTTDLFKKESVLRFANYFLNVIRGVVENQDIRIKDINILPGEEKVKLLHQFNDTYSSLPELKTVMHLFDDLVNRNPEATAYIYEEDIITYRQLNDRVEKLAGYLKDIGLKKGELVASLIDRKPDYCIAFLAVIKNGGTFLPIYPEYPNNRINYILHESKAGFLIGEQKFLEQKGINFKGEKIGLQTAAHLINKAAPLKTNPSGYNESLYVIFTSGTTGFPKGVVNTETGLLNRLNWGWKQYGYGKNEVCCQKTGIGFADHIAELFSPLLKGVSSVIINDANARNARYLAKTIDEYKISRIVLVPSLLKELLKIKTAGKADLESLKYIFSSGDRLTMQLANKFYKLFQTTRLINLYGSAEVSADVTFYEIPRFSVDHILSYFKNLTQTEKSFRYLNTALKDVSDRGYFTTPNIELKYLTENFKVSKVSDRLVSPDEYNRRLEEEVIPYSINTASPTFIGHMTSALPDFVHEVSKLISQMNQNQVKIETSKSFTLLEREAIAMLHRLFYNESNIFYEEHIQKVNTNMGIVASGGTTANISAILSARNRALFGGDYIQKGEQGINVYDRLKEIGYDDMVIIGSELMHYSFKKTASLFGFGTKNIRYVPNDSKGVMSVEGLKETIKQCKKEKLLIIAVVGIAGSTERGSIDPLSKIAEVTKEHQLHFHVDAAWGGALMFSKKYRSLLQGIEEATSITICGHKQLFLPQGISVCLFKDVNYLSYNSVTANYQAQPDTFDFGRFTIEGSRPALSLCLHAALRILGTKGYELLINNGIEKANIFAGLIKSNHAFQLLSCQINILNYRYIPLKYRKMDKGGVFSAEINEEINRINERIQKEQFIRAKTFVSKTTIKDIDLKPMLVFRTVISNPLTTKKDLINVLNDQLHIIEEIFDEKNRLYPYDSESDRMETEYEANRQRETSVLIGKPLQNTQILIVDKYGNLQPEKVAGEICIGGLGLAKEYLYNKEETERRFKHTELLNGGRIYESGDIGRWNADGNLEYLGRKDDQVKIQGFRIELEEIVFHLNSYKYIEQSVVVAKPIKGEKHLVAYYVSPNTISDTEISEFLAEKLPGYMIPSFYVSIDKIPLNSNGKIDRNVLPDPQIKSTDHLLKPESDIEHALLTIWSEILSIDKGSIGTDANFFEIGGQSVWLIELAKQINKKFNKEITTREIFLKPTIKQQALLINPDTIH